jgi:hypothetical protein
MSTTEDTGTFDGQPDRTTADQVEQMVLRAVAADMSGGSTDQVYRVLNARLHASGVAPDTEEVWERAGEISSGDDGTTGEQVTDET